MGILAAGPYTVMEPSNVASRIVAELAGEILALKERIENIDEELQKRFFARPKAGLLPIGFCQPAWFS